VIFSQFPDSDLVEVYNTPNPLFLTEVDEHVAVFPLRKNASYDLKLLSVAVNLTITPTVKPVVSTSLFFVKLLFLCDNSVIRS
jgi:hypothetical protein